MQSSELTNLLHQFLDIWSLEKVKSMTLDEYVNVNDKETFCQWVETKTRPLGSMKGYTSIKFGIYKREDPKVKPPKYYNDNTHSWIEEFGTTKSEAFDSVKKAIIEVIEFSEKGQFDKIDAIKIPDLFKWKIAFLYSNERLIPIYKRKVLHEIGRHFGLKINRKTKVSQIHEVMIENKPIEYSVYEFMHELYDRFGRDQEQSETKTRKPSDTINTDPYERNMKAGSYIVDNKHGKIQKALHTILIEKYGKQSVTIEDNFVDLKVTQFNYVTFYEVKSASYAIGCIRQALGQVLLYAHRDQINKTQKIIVAGQYAPSKEEKEYISFLKKQLTIEFDYINVEI